MDLYETPEDQAFRAEVRHWFEQNRPSGKVETLEEKKAWHRRLFEAGFVGMGWPKAYGGRDARPMEQAIVADEMTRANAPGWINSAAISFLGPTVMLHGTEWQKQRYLPKILTAEELWCGFFSEPNAGSDLAALQTTALRKGDRYIVNGEKLWTTQAMISDYALLLARTDPAAPKHRGISYFIVDVRTPGIDVQPLRQITGTAEFSHTYFTNVEVPAENLIGEEGDGWRLAQTTFGYERSGNALARYRGWKAHLMRLVEVCRTLPRGNGCALDDPLVRQKLGRITVDLEVMRYAGLRVLSKLERGERPGAESSVDKLFYSELDKRQQELIQEILGPYGQLTDLPPELNLVATTNQGYPADWAYNFLWSRAGTIYSGSSEIQKNIIGERVLGLPREPRADRAARNGTSA